MCLFTQPLPVIPSFCAGGSIVSQLPWSLCITIILPPIEHSGKPLELGYWSRRFKWQSGCRNYYLICLDNYFCSRGLLAICTLQSSKFCNCNQNVRHIYFHSCLFWQINECGRFIDFLIWTSAVCGLFDRILVEPLFPWDPYCNPNTSIQSLNLFQNFFW